MWVRVCGSWVGIRGVGFVGVVLTVLIVTLDFDSYLRDSLGSLPAFSNGSVATKCT